MEDSVQNQIQWLVRKRCPPSAGGASVNGSIPMEGSQYNIFGPYLTAQVRTMIQQEMLDFEDEVCGENGYWFSLHEAEEVKKYFGVQCPMQGARADEEITQPDLILDVGGSLGSTGGDFNRAGQSTGMIKISRLPSSASAKSVAPGAAASELGNRFQRVSIGESLRQSESMRSRQIFGVEKSRFWGLLLLVWLLLAGIGVLWVIKSLKV